MIHPDLIKKQRMLLIALLILIGATAFVSIGMGYSSVSYNRLVPTLLGEGSFKEEFILFSIRLPYPVPSFRG